MEQVVEWDRAHLQQLPIAVFVVDVDTWCVHETNAAGERLLGVSRDSIVGATITAHAAERAGAVETTLEEMAAVDGQSRRRELVDGGRIFLDGPAGNEVPVELRARRLTTGDSDRLAVVVQDISRSVRRSRRLQTVERALDHAFNAIYVTDETGEIRQVNRKFEEVTGYTATDVRGVNAELLEPGNNDTASFVDHYETVADGEAWTEEVLNERATGEQFAAKQTVVPVVAPKTGLDGFVLVQKDITEPKVRSQQVDVFHRVLRHNLRNAITVVQGHTEHLLDNMEDEENRHRLRTIQRRVRSLLETSEKAQVARKAVLTDGNGNTDDGFASTLERVARQIASAYPEATISFRSLLDDPVQVDSRATTVVHELVENAFEHANTSAPHVSVVVDHGYEGVTVTVTDNGPGISAEERRALEATTGGPLDHTSGLGLWLVNWIAETLGGSVDIEESGTGGTTILATLPTTSP